MTFSYNFKGRHEGTYVSIKMEINFVTIRSNCRNFHHMISLTKEEEEVTAHVSRVSSNRAKLERKKEITIETINVPVEQL